MRTTQSAKVLHDLTMLRSPRFKGGDGRGGDWVNGKEGGVVFEWPPSGWELLVLTGEGGLMGETLWVVKN